MGAVAVGADRRLFRSGGDRVSVHAQLVRSDHLRALSAVLHNKFLAVAGSASGRDVGVVHPRFRIAGRQQLMRASMAIDAGSCVAVASLNSLAVETAVVRCLLVGVASCAGDFQGRSFVRGTLDVGVAIHAGKHAAMDGILEPLGVHMQAHRLAVDVVGQRSIAMASQTFFRSRFRRLLAGWRLGGRQAVPGG